MNAPGRLDPTMGVARRRVGTTVAVAFSMFCSLMTLGLAGSSGTTPPWNYGIGLALNLVAAVALVWRHRHPWPVLALALAGPLFFATDATAALIALFTVCRVAHPRGLIGAGLAAFIACGVSLTYDAHRTRDLSVLTIGTRAPQDGTTPVHYDVPLWVAWTVAAVLVALVIGAATLRRTRSDLTDAVISRDTAAKQSDALREQMLLDAERNRIARDMHDTLAASLSRIALFAGGLQVNSTGGPEKVANSASMIRQTAHEGLDELKRIIGVLRGGDRPGEGGRRSIDGIADLVSGAREFGVRITLVMDIAPGDVGALCSNTAYRVVQESLTNAQKHAQNAPLRVAVHGDPADGIRIDVRNHLVEQQPFAHGAHSGLAGLAEQVQTVGGTFDARPHGPEFVVACWLPWFS